jgi:hypothetical protein
MAMFKTLVFVNSEDKVLGNYALPFKGCFGGCDIPELMTMDATIDKLKYLFPDLDFSLVKLITLRVFETG